MNTQIKVLLNLAVAHSAGLRHSLAEFHRRGPREFVSGAVAGGAIGSGGVSLPDLLAVYAEGVLASLSFVAGRALRFGQVLRMRQVLVFDVALLARDRDVRRLGYLCRVVVTAGAVNLRAGGRRPT
jgi:hypothetical protein